MISAPCHLARWLSAGFIILLSLMFFIMDLASKALTVVSTDGSYFGVDSAYLVDLSFCSDEFIEDFQDGSDFNRAQVAVGKGESLAWILEQSKTKFISKNLMYEIEGWVYDSDKPEFKYLVPLYSGNFCMVDCWIVNEKGDIHPSYNRAGIAIGTRRFNAVGDSPFLEG